MAASLNNNEMLALPESHYTQQPVLRRGPGRRKTKTGAEQAKKKKEILRGMGVEKLERLRKAEEFSAAAVDHHDPGLMLNGAVFGGNRCFSYLGGFGSPGAGHVGHMATGHVVLEGHEISKKKRYNGVGDVGFGSRVMESDRVNIHQFGLNVGGNVNSNNDDYHKMFAKQDNNYGLFETPNFQNLVPQVGYATRPGRPGVEVLAVHKRGGGAMPSTSQATGTYVMEYEFFPGCSSNRSNKEDYNEEELKMKNKEGAADQENELLMMMKRDKYSAAAEEICLGIGVGTSSISSTSTSSSIDLSLKLSYD